MHWPVRIFCIVLTLLHAVEAPLSETHHQGPGLAANWNDHKMRRSLSAGGGIPGGRKKLPLSLGFKCAYCGGEFESRTGMDCHRRHRNSIGTPCADPMNSKSMSLTQRGDSYTGNLRLHDTLGVCTQLAPSAPEKCPRRHRVEIDCLKLKESLCHSGIYNSPPSAVRGADCEKS
jgi:hypothetical protein